MNKNDEVSAPISSSRVFARFYDFLKRIHRRVTMANCRKNVWQRIVKHRITARRSEEMNMSAMRRSCYSMNNNLPAEPLLCRYQTRTVESGASSLAFGVILA